MNDDCYGYKLQLALISDTYTDNIMSFSIQIRLTQQRLIYIQIYVGLYRRHKERESLITLL